MLRSNVLVGRNRESKLLSEYMESPRSEFIAIYGRRRVGKTFLVKSLYRDRFAFYVTAMANMNTQGELKVFGNAMNKFFGGNSKAKTWLDAFTELATQLEKLPEGPKIVFIDELPWFDTARSNFVSALEYFWNSWASDRNDIKLIVCGSATSWILNKLINNHGGLHNRVTHQIRLEPFTLAECKEYFKVQKFPFSDWDIALIYMVMGGIPFYLSFLNQSLSVAQNVDSLFFSKNAELAYEFENLYKALFRHSEMHVQVVTALAQKSMGLTRDELLKITGIQSSGNFTAVLDELESCGFIRRFTPLAKQKKDELIQLIDFYTLFYFKFIKENKLKSENFWSSMQKSALFAGWSGYAFEMLCLHHIPQIKNTLQISGMQSSPCSFVGKGDDTGAQIDLLIDRADNVMNVCEMKFTREPFCIDKSYAERLENKLAVLRKRIKTSKTLMLTMISAKGLKKNSYFDMVQNVVTLEDLMK